ncbi:MAG TPA: anaerobic ribonucleoside-triphosphate reductase activating protein [Candidimonas sp.]|nr:anaerobic ribonucleoside-triphosphate reductase activating protein [Candidimonas sp.]
MGGVTPFTATDYPGLLASVVFVQGCPWRCGYCHNPELQARTRRSQISWDDVIGLLKRRVGLVDAVVFSGGEPTVDPALADAITEVRRLGFKIGMHSGGTHVSRLKSVLPLLDWIGLDIKAPLASYAKTTGVAASGQHAWASLDAVLASGVDYECRTTAHPALLPEAQMWSLAQTLSGMGVRRYALQLFRAQGCVDNALIGGRMPAYPDPELIKAIAGLFPAFEFRGA